MKSINLNEESALLRCLFYGDSGSGKTTLIGSAMNCTQTSPLLVLNFRGQPASLRWYDPQPLVFDIEELGDLDLFYEWIAQGQPRPATVPDREPWPTIFGYLDKLGVDSFKSLAIDGLTHVQRRSFQEITGKDDKWSFGDIAVKYDFDTWNKTLEHMSRISDEFFKLPIHMFMSALVRHSEMPALGTENLHPLIKGQAAYEVPSHALLLGRLVNITSLTYQQVVEAKKYADNEGGQPNNIFNVLVLRGGTNFVAKWQGVLDPPEYLPNPTISKLYKILQGD